jgi:site-specific DNA recombinase
VWMSAEYRQSPSDALLTGKLFDHLGRPMTPSYAIKGWVRYRYYVSRGSVGPPGNSGTPVVRLSAPDIEETVLKALAGAADSNRAATTSGAVDDGPRAHNPIDRRSKPGQTLIERVDVRSGTIAIELVGDARDGKPSQTIVVPWSKLPSRVQRDVILPSNTQCEDPRAMSSDTRSRLLSAIAISRRWMDGLAAGRVESIDVLAARERRSARSVTMLLSLAFMAPDLVTAIVDARAPRGIGLA